MISLPFVPFDGLVLTNLTETKEEAHIRNFSHDYRTTYFNADAMSYEHRDPTEVKRLTAQLISEGWTLE